jgi:CelD/BcsL family acetyltransferase involved in cellulose biosynthesis
LWRKQLRVGIETALVEIWLPLAIGRFDMRLESTIPGSSDGARESQPMSAYRSAQTTLGYSVTPVVTDQEVSSLEADWNRLSKTAEFPNVFTTFDWFRAWNQRLAQEDSHRRPNILVVRKDGIVVGISPFVRRICSRLGFVVRKIEFVGNQADYNDFVLGGDAPGQIEAVTSFLAQTSNEWDLVELVNLREPGGLIPQIETALSRANLFSRILPEREGCPYLSIDEDASTLMNNLSGHVRRTLRRRMERAKMAGLRVRIVENPHQEPELLEKLVDLEHGRHSLRGSFIGKDPEVFRSLFNALGPCGWLYVALLEKGDDPVAFQLGFRCGNKLWDYSKAYDRSFSRFAPGTMLVHALLDYGFTRGYREYDFLRGEEPYKMVWSTGCHRGFRLLVWNRRWVSRGRQFVYCDFKRFIYQLLGRRV